MTLLPALLSAAEARHIESMLGTIQDWNEQEQRYLESFGITDIPAFDDDSPPI